ncbi:MAG: DUF6067 family protein [Armatimonadota bacterium]|nr:DUF6067 family protein [Armatimonadota bacterium]
MRVLMALCMMLAAALTAGEDQPLADISPPTIAVAKTPHPPTIDGTVEPHEWRFAAATTGFVNLADANLADQQTVVRISYDDQRLYVAFELSMGPEELPRTSVMERDTGVWADDSIEVYLLPEGGSEADDFFQLVGNSAGTIFDRRGQDKSWDGDWQFANRVERGHWSCELSIAWAELGVGDATGQVWRANFARSAGAFTSWAYTVRGYYNPPRWGFLRFAAETPLAQVDEIDTAQPGEVIVDGSVMRPRGAGRVSVGADLTDFGPAIEKSAPAPNNPAWPERLTWTLSAGGQEPFQLRLPTREEGRKLLYVAAADEGGALIYHQVLPLVARQPRYLKLHAHPSERIAFLEADLSTIDTPPTADVHLRVSQREGDFLRILRREGLRTGGVRHAVVSVAGWPMGEHDCAWRIVHPGTGEVLRSGRLVWEQRAMPEWYKRGSRLGRGDSVPPPWTPMECSSDRVQVWGRRYELGAEPLLAQVTSAGEELLAAPVRLEVSAGGGTQRLRLARRLVTRTRDTEAEYLATAELGEARVLVTTRAEFDGMLRFDLRFMPGAADAVEAMRLIVPLRPERATYYHHCSSYYARGFAGELPDDGLSLAFRPFVWLGDDERGLMWFAQSQRGWSVEGEPIQVRRREGATELVVTLIDGRSELGDRWITFGLQATPVKPVPEDWRAWRADRVYPRRLQQRAEMHWEERGIPLQWRYLWFADGPRPLFAPAHTTPLDVMDTLGEFADKVHATGTRMVPYLYLMGVSTIATDFERYYPAWRITSPRQIGGGDRVIMGADPASTFGDYLLAGIERWVTEHHVDGVYFDGAGPPVACRNSLHDHGWITQAGSRALEYPIFGMREFYKRLWRMLTERHEDPVIWIHADGKMATPCFSFATANWEGEMVQGPLRTGDAFLSDMLPLDFWRAHLVATQWGVVPMWLVTTSRTDEQMQVRQMYDTLALLLVHGTPFARRQHISKDLVLRVWSAQAEFGIGQATFHGYWENEDLVQLSPRDPRIVASLYERDGRVMLIVSNLTEQPQEVQVRLAETVRPGGPLTDCISDEQVQLEGDALVLTVEGKSFRMLR